MVIARTLCLSPKLRHLRRLAAICLSVAMCGCLSILAWHGDSGKPAGESGKWFAISEKKLKISMNGPGSTRRPERGSTADRGRDAIAAL